MGGRRVESVLLAAATAVLAAFLASALVGLGDGGDGRAADARAGPEPPVRVEVLNGAGRTDLARRATRRLRAHGFDVVYFGNADSFGWDRSVVIDRIGDSTAVLAAADALGIDSVERGVEPALHLDATIILGRDWTADGAADDEGARSWLRRLRRWLIGPSEPQG